MKGPLVGNNLQIKPSGRNVFNILESMTGLKKKKKKRVSQASRNIDQAMDNWTLENGYQRALCTSVLAGASHKFVKAKKQAENSKAV